MDALRWLGGLGFVAGLGWILSALPSRPPDGALVLTSGSLLLGAVAHGITSARRVIAATARAVDELARRSFAVTRSVLSSRRDVLVALDAHGAVALCELDRRGAVRVAWIASLDEVAAEATEDGQALDPTGPARRDASGRLVLAVSCRGTRHEVVFVGAVPEDGDGDTRWEEYERVRAMLAWWSDTLAGREPAKPYQVATELLLRVSRAEGDAAIADARRALDPALPDARVVSERA